MSKPTVIRMSAKCSDMFSASVLDENGKHMGDYNGYVPDFFPERHFGDYIKLEIDLQTGRILNWLAPSEEQIQEILEQGEEQ